MKNNNAAIRTIEILHLIATSDERLTASEISNTLAIPKSTCHQLLQTLVSLKVLTIAPNKTFTFGIRFFEISSSSFERTSVRSVVREGLRDLTATTAETSIFATKDEKEVVVLDSVEGTTMLRVSVPLGTRFPLHCTSLGRAILATLTDSQIESTIGNAPLTPRTQYTTTDFAQLLEKLQLIRIRGYAIDIREFEEDVVCIGAPLYDRTQQAIGAISAVCNYTKTKQKNIDRLGLIIKQKALDLSRRIGFTGQSIFPIDN